MRRRRNPFGIRVQDILLFGGLLFVISKLDLFKGAGPPDTGIQIRDIKYFTPVRSGAHQDFNIFLNHKGAGGKFKIRVSLTTGTSLIPAFFGQMGTAVWEQFLYVMLPANTEWTSYDFHVTGTLNVDGFKTYNIYTAVENESGQRMADNWRAGAIYVVP
mgnify:CR=1 FL=1